MLLCTHELPVCKLNHLFCYLHLLLEPLKSRDGKLTDNMYFYFYYDGFVINFSSFWALVCVPPLGGTATPAPSLPQAHQEVLLKSLLAAPGSFAKTVRLLSAAGATQVQQIFASFFLPPPAL